MAGVGSWKIVQPTSNSPRVVMVELRVFVSLGPVGYFDGGRLARSGVVGKCLAG